jgi:CubicO group peptidase (beta-lactamase class C family)
MARAARLALRVAIVAASVTVGPAHSLAQPAPGLRAPAEAAFDTAIRAWLKRHAIVRASLAVMRDERLVISLGYGGRSPSERIGIWSLTKPITAACIATLVQDGRLSFEDRALPLLGALIAKHGPVADRRFQRITVRHLIEHRAGLPRSAGGNRFSPGMVEALRVSMTDVASVEQLLPAILKLRLARDPGVTYEYSNVGYLLLGQIIEQITGRPYAESCGTSVLAKAGIEGPTLGRPWGGLLHASAGWALSGPEYLAFARLLNPRRTSVLRPAMHEWMRRIDDRWIDDSLRTAYTLGVMLRVAPPDAPYLFHGGGWVWRQDDAKAGPIHEYQWTWFVLAADGTAWFVSFSGKAGDNERRIFDDLDRALWQARRNVKVWPAEDIFPSLGIGPAAAR